MQKRRIVLQDTEKVKMKDESDSDKDDAMINKCLRLTTLTCTETFIYFKTNCWQNCLYVDQNNKTDATYRVIRRLACQLTSLASQQYESEIGWPKNSN